MSKILIVEDEPSILSVLSTLLRSEGYDVTPAPGGDKAQEMLKTDAFDLMISDIRMTPVDASATEVRQLLASGAPDAGRRLSELVPATVLDYSRAHRLYT